MDLDDDEPEIGQEDRALHELKPADLIKRLKCLMEQSDRWHLQRRTFIKHIQDLQAELDILRPPTDGDDEAKPITPETLSYKVATAISDSLTGSIHSWHMYLGATGAVIQVLRDHGVQTSNT